MRPALKLKSPPPPLERDEAEWLLDWARVQRVTHRAGKRLSDYLIMIPNGAVLAGDYKHRAMQMARMKRAGFKPGVFDYFLALPSGVHHGLFLELKRTRAGVVSAEQKTFQLNVATDYACAICKGWDAARRAIEAYLLRSS